MKTSLATPEAPSAARTDILPRPARAAVAVRPVDRIGPLGLALLQWLATALMVYALLATPVEQGNRGLMNLTESIGALERTALWQRAFWWLPGAEAGGGFVSWSPSVINWTVRGCLVALFALHAVAFWRCWCGGGGSLWRWLVGPVGAHLLMIGFVPSNADVFFYAISGDLANSGNNPYAYPLVYFPENPLYPYNHWVDMTAVYGPVWTAINQGVVAFTGADPVAAVVGFKLVLGAAALALALLVFWLAGRITGNPQLALAAGVLVAWQPNLILESSGQAHNDAVMLLTATAGLALALVGGTTALRGAVVLLAVSVAVKYVTLPLLGLIGLVRLKDLKRDGGGALARAWLLDVVAVLAVWVAAFAPYWVGPRTLAEMVSEPGRNFSNPIWFVPYLLARWTFGRVVNPFFFGGVRVLLVIVTFVTVAAIAVWFGRQMLRGGFARSAWSDLSGTTGVPWWSGALLTAWTATLAALSFLPVNVHAWYWTWPVVPVALLVAYRAASAPANGVGPQLPRWFWPYMVLSAVLTLAYHTRVVHL